MTARDVVLDRIRQANASTPVPDTARAYRQAGDDATSVEVLVDLFVDRLREYGAGVSLSSRLRAARAVTDALNRHVVASVVIPDGLPPDLCPLGRHWLADDPILNVSELDAIDAVVTSSAVSVAETGTIILDAGPGMGRRALTLLPDLHVVVVRESVLVRGVPEALRRLDPARPLTWISGPSATSDIELNRVEGVHGPRRLEVIIVGD